MDTTTAISARVDTCLKEDAEKIMCQFGVTPSDAISFLYRQIVLTKTVPVGFSSLSERPAAVMNLSNEEVDKELQEGIDSLKSDKTFTADEIDAMLLKDFGI